MTKRLQQELGKALKVGEVSKLLGVSDTTVHALITAGELRAMNIGTGQRTHWRVDVEDLDDYRERAKKRTEARAAQVRAS